jgi:PGF-CTERM protein
MVAAQDDGESETGELRVVHASPDAPNVDVYVDGDAVLEDVEFGAVSEYLELPPDTYQIEVTAAGDADTSVFDEEVEVGEGDYTALAIGELAEDSETPFEVEVLEDDNSPTNEGEARVRAVHASPDAPNVDITVESTGDALFEDVGFGDAAYVSVPEGEYTLEIRAAQDDNQGDVVTTFDLDAEAGAVYSAFAVGYLSPDDAPGDEAFEVVPTLDAEPGEAEPTPTVVTFEDQTSEGDSVVVAESSHESDYVVVVHEDDDGAPGDIIGSEGDLDSGVNEGVTVTLNESLDAGEHTLHAMLHATSEDGEYGSPLTVDGEVVVESADVTVEAADEGMDDGMEEDNGTEEDGDMDDGMDEDGDMDEGEESEDNETGDGGDGGQGMPGFTAVAAVVALLSVALIAARRSK